MKYLSVCSGIEAATVAWHLLGWMPVAFAEIDRFASTVLTHHYPHVPNLGDMTRFQEWPDAVVDVLVGGTPCQSFSVAGLRAGLVDPRGNLALTYLAVVDRYRPRWLVWENVPGVLSSISHAAPDPCPPPPPMGLGRCEVDTEDEYDAEELHAFQCFLAGLSELGYGWAYRSLDAQYFRLAQRRRRVFVVGHLGEWRRAAAVLFERESLSGHPAPSREAREDVARPIAAGSRNSSGYRNDADTADNLIAADVAGTMGAHSSSGRSYGSSPIDSSLIAFGCNNTAGSIDVATAINAHGGAGRMDFESETLLVAGTLGSSHGNVRADEAWTNRLVAHALRGDGFDASEDGTGRGTPLVAHALRGKHNLSHRSDSDTLVADTLGTNHRQGTGSNSVGTLVAFDTTQITSAANRCNPQPGDPCHPLAAGAHPPAVAFDARQSDILQYGDMTGPLDTDGFTIGIHAGMRVRRLTPRECERLQGFPDDYTLIAYRSRPAKDGPRYKALGNSMAVPVMRWIGRRIDLLERLLAEGVA